MTGKVISILNDKGGVGKSTDAVCLSVSLMMDGKRVALVDSDARHSCQDWSVLADRNGYPTPLIVCNSKPNIGTEIAKLAEFHDYIVVDGMSSFVSNQKNEVISAIIKASDYIFIPTTSDHMDLWALEALTDPVKARQMITDGKPVAKLYGSKIRDNTREWSEFLDSKAEAPFPIMEAYMPAYVEIARTIGTGKTPFALAENDKARISVTKWINEVKETIQ
jgi:chromosome partitioning protein